ncbi:NAD-dependent epimerase/dehydratase family protein, partial [candidate division KSB1 bacterium]|nr:NAD-dependent epimerase/dehydratase family protein [candidate division KSB1 bacterium]
GPTTKNRWSYSSSKAIDEFLSLAYHKEKKLDTIVVRLFNTVGPRQTGQYGMVVPRFVSQALHGEPITVYGSGKQVRCFAYVSDVVEALVNLSENDKAVGQIFNVGNDNPISIVELAEKVKKTTNSDSEIKYVSYEEAYEEGFEDMSIRVPDLTKIKKLIGYEPKVHIDEILKNVVEYFATANTKE